MRRIEIRNVPNDLHRALKERAAREGRTMSEMLLRELPRIADRRPPAEVLERIRRREPVGGPPAADLIRAERRRR
jgi:hypothetical protein